WAGGALAMARETDWRAALGHFRRCLAALREQNRLGAWEAAAAEQHELACRVWLGELGGVAERVSRSVRAAELRGDQAAALGLRLRFGAPILLWRDDGAGARRELEAALALWRGAQREELVHHEGAALARAELVLYLGEPDRLA